MLPYFELTFAIGLIVVGLYMNAKVMLVGVNQVNNKLPHPKG